MSSVADATRETFRDLVAEGTVLVDVWGPRCAPCLALAPAVEQIASERPDLRVVKLDASQARRLCMEMRVMGLPTFMLFVSGEEVARLSEPSLSASRLREWVGEQSIAGGGR